MDTMVRPTKADYTAPDGSEIWLLPSTPRGGMAYCTLGVGLVTRPVKHRTVEEVWYCVAGMGQLWRRYGQTEDIVELRPGLACLIPFQTEFQFRTHSAQEYERAGSKVRPLELVLATFPGWPGADEAVPVAQGKWDAAT